MDEQAPQQMVQIRYVGIGEITVYLVTDDELQALESGGPASTYLNLAILFLSVGASFLAALLLAEVKSIERFIIMVIFTVGCLIAGFVLFVLWLRFHRDVTAMSQRIRARRIPPSGGNVIEGPPNP